MAAQYPSGRRPAAGSRVRGPHRADRPEGAHGVVGANRVEPGHREELAELGRLDHAAAPDTRTETTCGNGERILRRTVGELVAQNDEPTTRAQRPAQARQALLERAAAEEGLR